MPEITPDLYYVYVTENEGETPIRYLLTDEQYTVYILSGKLPHDAQPAPEETP